MLHIMHYVKMDVPIDGETTRSKLTSVVQQTNGEVVPPELLEKHPLPNEFIGVCNMFWQLNKTRTQDGPLDPIRIKAHLDLYNYTLVPVEYDALIAIDHAWIYAIKERSL